MTDRDITVNKYGSEKKLTWGLILDIKPVEFYYGYFNGRPAGVLITFYWKQTTSTLLIADSFVISKEEMSYIIKKKHSVYKTNVEGLEIKRVSLY